MTVSECWLIKLLPCISFEKYTYILALEMANSPMNQHCASCIGQLTHGYVPGRVHLYSARAYGSWAAEYRDQRVCLCVCLTVREHIFPEQQPNLREILCMLPVAVTRNIAYMFAHNEWPEARFTKYLTTILRLSYNNAKVTIDLQRTSNLQNILRRTQGFS